MARGYCFFIQLLHEYTTQLNSIDDFVPEVAHSIDVNNNIVGERLPFLCLNNEKCWERFAATSTKLSLKLTSSLTYIYKSKYTVGTIVQVILCTMKWMRLMSIVMKFVFR